MHAISSSNLLPFRIDELADRIQSDYENMWKDDKNRNLSKSELTYGPNNDLIEMLETSIANFSKAAKEWKEDLKNVDIKNPYIVRQMNDVMMGLERAFLKPEGLHERPEIKNLLYAPFKYDKYSTVVFPGMLDLMKKIAQTQRTNPTQVPQYWKLLRRHISDIAIAIRSATNLLQRTPL
jgi:N-acetylated-alpha-linked acidic dipeptidase